MSVRWPWNLIPRGRLAQGALLVMCWQACRLFSLAVWVVVAARTLGADGYGAFAGIAGLATAIAGFAGLGVGYVMYQKTAIDSRLFSVFWRKTLRAYAVSGIGLGLCFLLLASWMFPSVSLKLLVFVLASEVVINPFIAAAAFAFAAHERMGWSSALPALGAMIRVLAVVVYSGLVEERDLSSYLAWHVLASIFAAGASVLAVRQILKPAPSCARLSWQDLRESTGFCVVWFTNGAVASWDKALVLRLAGSELSGIYAAAYRFAALAAMPIDSLVMAAMPRLFRHGSSADSDPRLLRYVLYAVAGYGILAGAALAVLAPALAWLFGPAFSMAVDVARGIALMVPLYGLRQLGGHLLVAHDRRKERATIDSVALVLMTLLAILAIPSYGLQGAVVMIVTTELSLVVMTWIGVFRYIAART